MLEPHQLASRNRVVCWVGDNHVASWGDNSLYCSFLCLLGSMSEDNHCLMGAAMLWTLADLVEWVVLVGFSHVVGYWHGLEGFGILYCCVLRTRCTLLDNYYIIVVIVWTLSHFYVVKYDIMLLLICNSFFIAILSESLFWTFPMRMSLGTLHYLARALHHLALK